ncbi:hypothetical protein [Streptomyces sp. Ac-502]|uniref:hypothetical protein n=1 Tax=Streptomyces sp. Ac-502 TaxID=3342801 RepID=UPI003862AE9A
MTLDKEFSPAPAPPHRKATEKAMKGVLLMAAVVGGIPLLALAFIITVVAVSD